MESYEDICSAMEIRLIEGWRMETEWGPRYRVRMYHPDMAPRGYSASHTHWADALREVVLLLTKRHPMSDNG